MRSKFSKYRSSLLGTIAGIAITLLLVCGRAATDNKSTGTVAEQPTTTTEVTTTCATTTSTTTTTVTTTQTTTVTTTTTAPVTTVAIEVEPEVEPVIETECDELIADDSVVEEEPIEAETPSPLSDQDYILIANVVSHEAGSSWISTYERSQIVAAIINRVYDSRFPNTVDGVLHQSGQFFDVPYYRVDYSGIGYEPIDEAIALYFSGEYAYGSINSWSGNGTNNYFYTQ